jgi:glycosyltransferase involved in cell wall biosynthesis
MERTESLPKKLAIVSHTLPPDSNGQAVVLGRLLSDLDPNLYCLISGTGTTESTLPGKHVHIPQAPRVPRIKFLKVIVDPINLLINLWWWSRHLVRICREQSCSAIVSCTGDAFELPAACLAARRLRLPLYVYIFDWYRFKYSGLRGGHGKIISLFAQRIEGPILCRAAGIIVPNEELQRQYRELYGLQSQIVRNPTDFTPTDRPDGLLQWPRSPGKVNICYTGAIYDAHLGAFRNLLDAMSRTQTGNVRLQIYTEADRHWRKLFANNDQIDINPRVSLKDVQQVQCKADILFLPLAFDSPYPEIVNTSAPGKIGDYLASGRPILVHAPKDSFLAWYFREHECGVVVDEDDPAALAEAIERIACDPALRDHIVRRAGRQAREDFQVERARQVFLETVGLRAPAPESNDVLRDQGPSVRTTAA